MANRSESEMFARVRSLERTLGFRIWAFDLPGWLRLLNATIGETARYEAIFAQSGRCNAAKEMRKKRKELESLRKDVQRYITIER